MGQPTGGEPTEQRERGKWSDPQTLAARAPPFPAPCSAPLSLHPSVPPRLSSLNRCSGPTGPFLGWSVVSSSAGTSRGMEGTHAIRPWSSQGTAAQGFGHSAVETGTGSAAALSPPGAPRWAGQSPATWSFATSGRISPGGTAGRGSVSVSRLSSSNGSLVFSFLRAISFLQLT